MNINKNSAGKYSSPEKQSPVSSVNDGNEKSSVAANSGPVRVHEEQPVCDQSMYASPCNDQNNIWSYHRSSDRSMSAMQAGLW